MQTSPEPQLSGKQWRRQALSHLQEALLWRKVSWDQNYRGKARDLFWVGWGWEFRVSLFPSNIVTYCYKRCCFLLWMHAFAYNEAYQSTNRPANLPTNQSSINQSINQSRFPRVGKARSAHPCGVWFYDSYIIGQYGDPIAMLSLRARKHRCSLEHFEVPGWAWCICGRTGPSIVLHVFFGWNWCI